MSTFTIYHGKLFRWHCRRFFNFQAVLDRTEYEYLKACWRLANSFEEVSEGGYEHFSYYTYSHRVKGSRVNSSRIAYGSVTSPEPALEAARPVLAYRGVSLPEALTTGTKFYGLGWDFEKHDFKVYFRTLDWRALHPEFLKLAEGYSPDKHRTEALLSITYRFTREVERKLYLYPLEPFLPAGVRGYARMITDQRGEVSQQDLDPRRVGDYSFNETGHKIISMYHEVGETLDTVAYQDQDNFTLYFP